MRTSVKPRSATSATYVERVNRAIDHVVSHLREPMRLLDLARAARLSPFHFHRVFQALVGETPADFVKRLRLDLALRLMARARPPSLTAIALDCGFSSSSDFTRCFKQRFGVPPSVFNIKTWQAAHAEELESLVADAVALVHPWGVDACSRIESAPGKKDHKKMTEFLQAAKAALSA